MMARSTDRSETGASAAALAAAETPLQRQILLWQMELVRRAAVAERFLGARMVTRLTVLP